MSRAKVKLTPDCYEIYARSQAMAKVKDGEKLDLGGTFLGYIEYEQRGRKPWGLYTYGGDQLGHFGSPYVAVAKLAGRLDLTLGQIRRPSAVRYTVRLNGRLIGWIEEEMPGSWSWTLGDASSSDWSSSKTEALRNLLTAYPRAGAKP